MMTLYSSTDVRTLLKLYFEKSQDLAHQDKELYVLCVQCFEVRYVHDVHECIAVYCIDFYYRMQSINSQIKFCL